MPPTMEDVYLNVTATEGKDSEIDWGLADPPNTKTSYLNGEELDFTGVRAKYFRIHFTLPGPNGRDLLFPANVAQAIWVSKDGGCPKVDPRRLPSDFKDTTVSPDRRTLSITNKNKTNKRYAYALRMQRNGIGRFLEYDPVVVSGGGGNDDLLAPRAVIAVAAIAAIAGVAVALGRGRKRDRPGRRRF